MIKIDFMKLIYSYSRNDLCVVEIQPEGYVPSGYVVIAEQMDRKDVETFVKRIQRKYVEGRKSGRFPTTEIIMLELELFIKLKTYRRKLV